MYRIFNISLDSDIPLPELPKTSQADKILTIRSGTQEARDNIHPQWFHNWLDANDKICISCGRVNDDYFLRFPELAEFLITLSDNSIAYFSEPNIPDKTIRHLLLDQVVPRVLGHQGKLILHASAVKLSDGRSIAFLGNSGWGKSTIASSYHNAGAELITDDCLLIDTRKGVIQGIPNYYGLRLFEDSEKAIFSKKPESSLVAHYSDKKRLVLHNQDPSVPYSGVQLNAIFLLSDPELQSQSSEIIVEPVKGTRELMALIEQMFILDVSDKQLIAEQFKNIGNIVSTNLPIYRLQYPHDHMQLAAVRKAISDRLKS